MVQELAQISGKRSTSFFLGQQYDRHTDPDSNVTCHISQQDFIKQTLERFKLEHCKPARTPYQSEFKIDQFDHDDLHKSEKQDFIKECQSIVGCIN